ncbi:type II secretion system F family protein [Parvularcula flava]|uniref:Type II secretion system F family protein n=1 Tax=Aquisalinus luteolus TaxID=1566827 RepID=A0A8J3EPE5_9PROT|nr:type II secretion system F family protein [Aquisalinus luteolus]NHK27960.1 type II secretion system F family protein [Aquisalinus luteolus]GGH97052.1 type II secretion system protein [Aquisalinus luteolus]
MEDFLNVVMDRQNQIAFLAAVATVAAAITILGPMLARDPMAGRLKEVSDYKSRLRDEHRESLKKKGASLRTETAQGMAREIVEQFKLLEFFDAKSAAKKLAQAGYRGERPVFTFMLARLVMPFLACFAVGCYVYIFNGFDLGSFMRLMATIGAFAVGFYLPNIWLTNTITKRRQKMQLFFPDALDLLLICVESGMSIEHALQKVSEEIAVNCPELAQELALTTAELSYLPDRKVAYQNLADRVGTDGMKSVVTALIQTENYGTPLGQSLRVMAAENRELRMQAAEKKAAALPPKLTVPMILFFLPVLFAIILGPAMLRVFGMDGPQ